MPEMIEISGLGSYRKRRSKKRKGLGDNDFDLKAMLPSFLAFGFLGLIIYGIIKKK